MKKEDNSGGTQPAEEQQQQLTELGASTVKTGCGTIQTLTIIGQIEGHQEAPEGAKTTKYEHVLPLLTAVEESGEVDGLLILLNTMGGDIEAGLAISELIAGMKQGWSFAWRALMSGEVMTTSIGLGQTLITGRNLADINQVMLVMVVIVLVGIFIDQAIFRTVEKRVLRRRGLEN